MANEKVANNKQKDHTSVNQYAPTIGSPGIKVDRRGTLGATEQRLKLAFPRNKVFKKGKRYGKSKK